MLSLVLPTYNEAANLPALISVIDGVLQNTPHEVIVVDDDSPDGTWKVAERLQQSHPSLRIFRRIGRTGLSSAVTDGFDMAIGDTLAVMDADGQHDAELLLQLLSAVDSGADIAIGSRYVPGGSVGEWVRDRRIISSIGTFFAKALCRAPVSDPLGGFFAIKTSVYKDIRPHLRPTGFKILLEILANIPRNVRVAEVPLVFRMRLHGRSKLSFRVHLAFMAQVLRLGAIRILSRSSSLCGVFFWVAVAATFLILLPRLWNMRLLYLDPAVRASTEIAVRITAARRGWMLSDVSILRAGTGSALLRHREHRRGGTTTRCTVTFSTNALECENPDL